MNPAGEATTADAVPPPRAPMAPRERERTDVHTRILRVGLAIEEARAYFSNVGRCAAPERVATAFEERWFGGKSLERVRFLVATFAERFEPFPLATAALLRWRSVDVATLRTVCHVHVQLTDVLYRRFTREVLVPRRTLHEPSIDRSVVLRWLRREVAPAWSEATYAQCATKLLSAATEAGLVAATREPRRVLYPKVTDEALTYVLYLLRHTKIEGSLTENPYLASLGLEDDVLHARLRELTGVGYRRMQGLSEFEWRHADLEAWVEALT